MLRRQTAPRVLFLALCVLVMQAERIPAQHESNRPPRYESDVAPIFKAHCTTCHNAEAMKAELDLSSPRGIFQGSESGAVVVPQKVDDSLLFHLVHEREMPPEDGKPLSDEQIETIRRWIDAGTPFDGKTNPAELIAAAEVSNHDIQPLMLLRCAACHGLRTKEAGLDLRTKASMLKGGKSGPAIVLGKPQQSLLLIRIHASEMPPPDKLIEAGVKPITAGEIDQLTRWIELGAPEVVVEPDVATSESDPLVAEKDRQFWSFQPPADVSVPAVNNTRVRSPIDAFILQTQIEHGLNFSPEADKLALLRRAHFDLTGLPPDPELVESFLADEDPLAFERLIDRLLASPRYGERWARFWLDAAGYADSEGKRSADPIRPYAYKYRDYVIRALNSDKPYDRFLLEQIAGDELADYASAQSITRELADNLVATGFLRMAPDGTGSDVVNFVPERLEVMSDQIDVFSSTILGLTIKCARCHSHKYDPIPQRDYYRLVDVFKGAFDEHDWLKPAFVAGQTKVKRPGRVLPVATDDELREVEDENRRIDGEILAQREKLEQLAESIRNEHFESELAKLPSDLHAQLRTLRTTAVGERTDKQKRLAEKFEDQLTLDDSAVKIHAGYKRAKVEADRLIKSLEGEKQDGPLIRALWDRGEPSSTYIYRRGDYTQPSRLVGPGVPSVLTDGKTPLNIQPPWPGAASTGRRLALAKWLVEPDHPLTARVMVNRIWKHHFGEGIVRSLENFGRLGTPPTHPELLDWLAREFVRSGWSVKHVHRMIMTSTTYRQSSLVTDQHAQLDPENKWLARMPLRRLDAEEVRDSLLAVAGELNLRQFGRPDPVDVRGDGLVTSVAGENGRRRSIYLRQRRKEMPTVLETFDLPQMNPNCVSRTNSTVAQQALYLLNDSLVRELSAHFARRAGRETLDPSGQVEQVYLIAIGRPPSEEERQLGAQLLAELTEKWAAHLEQNGQSRDEAADRALQTFCHAVMNSAEFLFID